MKDYKMFNETGEYNKFFEAEDKKDVNIDQVIKSIKDTEWSGSDEEQMKALELLKGVFLSKDPKAKSFIKALDKATSNM